MFRWFSLPYIRRHRLRVVITVCGVGLGVGTVIGLGLLNEALDRTYEHTLDRIAGKAALKVTNGDVGVPEELLAEIRTVPGVRIASGTVQAFIPLQDQKGERLFVFAVDVLANDELNTYDVRTEELDDSLSFVAQPDSVALATTFLKEKGLAVGDTLRVLFPSGMGTLTIRAALDVRGGPATLFGGRVAVMDVGAAQKHFLLDRRFTRIDVAIVEDASLHTVRAALEARVGARGVVERAGARGEGLGQLLELQRYASFLVAIAAVVVGFYLVFNTMTLAVVHRTRELGILRALGVTPVGVLRLVAVECVALGLIGAVVGVPIGLVLASTMSLPMALNVAELYALPLDVPKVGLHVGPVLLGAGVSLLGALATAVGPVRRSLAVHPIDVIRGSQVRRPRRGRRVPVAGIAALLVAVVAGGATEWMALGWNGGTLVLLSLFLGAILLLPGAIRAVTRALAPAWERLGGPLGMLAGRHLARDATTVTTTCVALVVSLAAGIAVATWLASFQQTLGYYFDGWFSEMDLVVTAGAEPTAQNPSAVPEELSAAIGALPGVEDPNPTRLVKIEYAGATTMLVAGDGSLYARGIRRMPLLEGDEHDAFAALAAGRGVFVNEAFTRRFGLQRGDTLSLATPSGGVDLPIVAIYFELSFADLGTIFIDRSFYRRTWGDRAVNFIQPLLSADADLAGVMREIRERWGAQYGLFIVPVETFRGEITRLLAQSIALSYPLIVVSIGIALMGLVNAVLASVLDRSREIAVARAIGASPTQILRAVMLESGILGSLGGTFAVIVGSVVGYYQIAVLFRGMFGITLFYHYPVAPVVFGLVASAGLAALAGYLPGRRAMSASVPNGLS